MTENCLFRNNDKFFNRNIGENRNENENCHQWKMAINNNSVSTDRLIVFVSKVCQFVFFFNGKMFSISFNNWYFCFENNYFSSSLDITLLTDHRVSFLTDQFERG